MIYMYNNRTIAVIILFISLSLSAVAQKKQFTMAEATNGMSTTLAAKNVKDGMWQPGTANFWQVEKREKGDVWAVINCNSDENRKRIYEQGQYPETVKSIPSLKWLDEETVYFMNGKHMITGKVDDEQINWVLGAEFPEKAEHITVDKSGRMAYTLDNNLFLMDHEKGVIAVTKETDKGIVCGQSVHRDEFGISGGIFFSPKGNLLAYYRMDQTMVKDYPIIQWNDMPATNENIKYPMAGKTSHEVTLCVYDPASGKTVTMKTGEDHKDHYLTSVTWSPDEKYIYIAILNRGQDHLYLNKYDAATGNIVKTLFEESDKKYVHPTHSLTFLPWQKNEFIWWSERNGYDHLYLYNTEGRLKKQLTNGKWVVNEVVGFNPADKKVIITASKESPSEKHIYTVGITDGSFARIDKGDGMHTASCSEDGSYVFDVYNGAGTPRNSYIRSADGKFSRELLKSPDPLADYDRAIVKNVTIKSADGVTPLYAKLILPPNFDKNKKYPVIVYLYNGPNVQLLHNSFPESGNLWYEYMAQHGYIVFTMDGRGSWNRGLKFEQATFRHLGTEEMADQLKGVDYLKSLPYVDAGRMGVHGWSFGGSMTTSLMLKHPGVFKCGVAGGPVMDWRMYEVMYTERYMDTPDENPEGYEQANLLSKVKNLQGKLLLIHGTNDNTVVWQHSINFLKKSVDEGVQVDYFVYPGYEHNVRGKDRIHLMQKITDYFDLYLK